MRAPQKVRVIPISKLLADDKNANKGTKRGKELLARSLKQYGAGRSILIDKNNRVIAGNKTLEQAAAAGIKHVVVVEGNGKVLAAVRRGDLDLTSDKKAKELAVADNRTGEIDLEWNAEVLAALDIDLGDLGFKESELRALGISEEAEGVPDPQLDKAAQLQKKWKTERGQIWEIGKHRLMCGDSSSSDATKLMGKEKAWMMATDPPYGVGYGVESGPDSARRFDAMNSDENDGPELQKFLESVFNITVGLLEKGAVWYLWHAQMTQGFFSAAAAAAAAQFRIHRQIIWSKSHFILGHGDFHWQHELCFYGWREGEKHRWFGGRDQSTLWEIPNPRIHENHPTEKPPEIFRRAMDLSTQKGEIYYEPFSGSGSQLCAAESCGRICRAMEIEPKYVAVALERLSEMGLKPKLLGENSDARNRTKGKAKKPRQSKASVEEGRVPEPRGASQESSDNRTAP